MQKYVFCSLNIDIVISRSFWKVVFCSSVDIKISRKITFFWDHFFWPYIRKYQLIDENNVFWDHFGKIVFCPYLPKYQHLGIKLVLWDNFKEIVVCSSVNIKISRKTTISLKLFWKNKFFLSIYRIYQHFDKNGVSWDHFVKSFLSISS